MLNSFPRLLLKAEEQNNSILSHTVMAFSSNWPAATGYSGPVVPPREGEEEEKKEKKASVDKKCREGRAV